MNTQRLLLALFSALLTTSPALAGSSAIALVAKTALGPPGWVLPYQPVLQFDFARGATWKGTGAGGGSVVPQSSLLTVTRASDATDLLPSSVAGASYATFTSNQAVRTPNIGLLHLATRTNRLLNSTAPATQTTASIGTGTYTLWVNGTGSATSSAGTATGSGFGTATNGIPNVFTLTGAGTVVVTVSGSLNAFQLEAGTFGTSLIVTAGAVATRAADTIDVALPGPLSVTATEYVLASAGIPLAPNNFAATQILSRVSDGTTNNFVSVMRLVTTSNIRSQIVFGGVNQAVFDIVGPWSVSALGKVAVNAAASAPVSAFNGTASAVGAPITLPVGMNAFRIGNSQAANQPWHGYISSVGLLLTTAPVMDITQ